MSPRLGNSAFLVEMGFLHVGQAVVLELLTSGDLPASVSQSGGITGMSYCAWLVFILFTFLFFLFAFYLSDLI